MDKRTVYLVGYASGVAGADKKVGDGPLVMQQSLSLSELKKQHDFKWGAMIQPQKSNFTTVLDQVKQSCEALAQEVSQQIQNQFAFTVIGGDHSSAIGTWSGAYDALHKQGAIGLIWIDAHMDSHTPQTSESGRIHGMPLACLLGYGENALINLLHPAPKILPQNLCLIGIRSFEEGEAALLKRLNVRVYLMEEVKERGFAVVLNEAVKQVSAHTVGYGISLDLDGLDPTEAPGVDVPVADGIKMHDLLLGLKQISNDKHWIGTEIVEFDPSRDKNKMTEKVIASLLKHIHFGAD
jgi:arginase